MEAERNMMMENQVNQTNSLRKMTNSQKILEYLQQNPEEISNEVLSEKLGIDKTNIPRELKKLETQGYIISKRYEQIGRAKYVWFQLTTSQRKETNSQNKKRSLKTETPLNEPKQSIKNSESKLKDLTDHNEIQHIIPVMKEKISAATIPINDQNTKKIHQLEGEIQELKRMFLDLAGIKGVQGLEKKLFNYIKENRNTFIVLCNYAINTIKNKAEVLAKKPGATRYDYFLNWTSFRNFLQDPSKFKENEEK